VTGPRFIRAANRRAHGQTGEELQEVKAKREAKPTAEERKK